MTTYTIRRQDGEILERGESMPEAANTMLTHDGHEYSIKKQGDMYKLFVSRFSNNSYGGNGGLAEWPDYVGQTENDVYQAVIKLGGVLGTTATPDEEYDAMVAALEADEGEGE
jgi:hypothetical protein